MALISTNNGNNHHNYNYNRAITPIMNYEIYSTPTRYEKLKFCHNDFINASDNLENRQDYHYNSDIHSATTYDLTISQR